MPEKEVWTLDGRKKIYLVDDQNHIIKELKDLGPLNYKEKKWLRLRPGVPYKEWLKSCEDEESEKAAADE